MQIHFFGATRTTTGSMYLFEVNQQQVLLECGLFQGKREESIERNRRFPFDPSKLNAEPRSHRSLRQPAESLPSRLLGQHSLHFRDA